jgi:hypothetical protein
MFLDIGMFTVTIGLNAGSAKNSASIARAGRASRLGTRLFFYFIFTIIIKNLI